MAWNNLVLKNLTVETAADYPYDWSGRWQAWSTNTSLPAVLTAQNQLRPFKMFNFS